MRVDVWLVLALALAIVMLVAAAWVNGALLAEKETWRKMVIYECWRTQAPQTHAPQKSR